MMWDVTYGNGSAEGCEDAFHISHRDSCHLYVAVKLKSTPATCSPVCSFATERC